MKHYTKLIACAAIALCCTFLESCRTVPITGRSQFIMSSPTEENALGLQAFTQEKQQYGQSSNATYNAVLNNCASALIAVAEEPSFQWQVAVLNSKEQNAFCAPGGKIGVYSGIMDIMNNEAELAFVVAHEIGHAIARHYGERTAWGSLIETGGEIIKSINPESTAASIYGPATKLGITLPFSRRNEYEADEIGLILMARAGYNPNAAIEFWSRFSDGSSAASLNPLSGLMRTHPKDADRINAMREVLPRALEEYAKAPVKRGYGTSF